MQFEKKGDWDGSAPQQAVQATGGQGYTASPVQPVMYIAA